MKTEKTKYEEELRKILNKGGRKVYTIIRHCSSNGMFRRISCFSIHKNVPVCIDCGMDMGFSVVYNLGSQLYPKGDGKTITGRNGDKKPETDGGYLLRQIWL